jgi:hypothetical protein
MIAKQIVKNKFWIVENEGKKIATIQQHNDGIAWVNSSQREQFANIDLLKNYYNLHFDRQTNKTIKTTKNELYEYPCDQTPFNQVWDIKHRVPLYTKTKKSKCYHVAGYFVVDVNNKKEVIFCPKYIYIQRYEYLGPYKTEKEALVNK